MKYVINGYQTIYENGSRDKIKLTTPIYSDDIEAVRTKLKKKHSGIGKKCLGVNLDYTEINDKV
jgi:hypothetical protein